MKKTAFGQHVLLASVLLLPLGASAQDAAAASREAGRGLLEKAEIKGPSDWETTLSAGTTLTSGNSETLNATARVGTEKLHGKTLVSAQADGAYGESQTTDEEGTAETEQTVGNARAALSLKQRIEGLFLYSGASVENDTIAEVDYRSLVGAGVGTFLVDDQEIRLSIEGGLGYLFEKVQDLEDDYPTFRLGQRLDIHLSETAKAWQSIEFLPKASELDNYLLTFEAGIDAAINTEMSLGLVLKQKHDSTPGEGLERDDLSLAAQVSMRL